jgi:hypothetical protein
VHRERSMRFGPLLRDDWQHLRAYLPGRSFVMRCVH